MSEKPPAIRIQNLYRTFGDVQAVRGISFEIPAGQVVGFVGANGAGKTTTMRILATLDVPTSGRAELAGIDVLDYPDQARALLGWMPDAFGTYDNMTVIEYLDFFARALGYKAQERTDRLTEVMEFTDLTPLADRFIDTLSKGMAQRLCLGRALLHDPEVLVLDEPAAGLDPKARVELKSLIRILAEEGKTILISSHILSELGEMCDRLLFIDDGKIIHDGDADSLKRDSAANREEGDTTPSTYIDVQLAGENPTAAISEWAVLQPDIELDLERKNGARLLAHAPDDEHTAAILRRMIEANLQVTAFARQERNLEDAFIDILNKAKTPLEDAPPPIPR